MISPERNDPKTLDTDRSIGKLDDISVVAALCRKNDGSMYYHD